MKKLRAVMLAAVLLAGCSPTTEGGDEQPDVNDDAPTSECDALHNPCGAIVRSASDCVVAGTPPGALPQLDPAITPRRGGIAVGAVTTDAGLVVALEDGRFIDESGASLFDAGVPVRSFAAVPGQAGRWVYTYLAGNSLVVMDAGASTRRELFRLAYQTAAVGGAVAFDGDGNLLVGFGDDDSDELAAQDPNSLYGSIVRVTLGALGEPARPTEGNPFDGMNGAEEVFAFGVHDPRALAVSGGRTWLGERGRHYDEVDIVEPGKNYGWPYVDGRGCAPGVNCAPERFAGPAVTVLRGEGSCGIVGGALYPADGEIEELRHAFLFADACDGAVHAMRIAANGRVDTDIVAVHDGGELVAMPTATALVGASSQIDLSLAANAGGGMFPTNLAETGCFDVVDGVARPRDGLVPFFVRSPLWTDGAVKRRWLVVPDGGSATLTPTGHLEFPAGSLLFKSFGFVFPDVGERTVELRVMRRNARTWSFFTYRFGDGEDAEVLTSRDTAFFDVVDDVGDVAEVEYLYPDSGSCRTCHQPNQPVLGPRVDQLAGPLDYGDAPRDQLAELAELGLVEQAEVVPLPDPSDETVAAHDRARAYLDANCSHCHRPGGWVPPDLTMDLRYATAFADASVCGTRVQYLNPFVDGAYRVAPGSPEDSAIYQRMMMRGFGQMPLLATSVIDPLVGSLFTDWIANLDCQESE